MTRRLWFGSVFTACLAVSVVIAMALTTGCKSRDNETVVTEQKAEEEKVEEAKVSKETKVTDSNLKMVKLETSLGDIVIELDEAAAPVTVKNFLGYVEGGFFDGTIFHRVINGFMIQGGGFTADMRQKQTHSPIVNEAKNGLKNDRGTIAMARTNDPDSATSQFFINHKDNDFLNYVEGRNPGYAVFGRTVEGMDVVDKIAAVKTTVSGGMRDVPAETVLIKSAKVVSDK
jgi:cyclophilin family peptidyl-prolyl cis-trans isomerase